MKGMSHTPFAIFGVTVLFLLFMVPLNSIPQDSEIYVKGAESANSDAYLLEDALRKGVGITASNYIEAANQYVAQNGFVSDANDSIDFESGKFNGTKISYVNYSEWTSDIESSYVERGHQFESGFGNLTLETGLELNGSADMNYNFTHSSHSTTYRVDSQISGLEGLRGPDPLLKDASSNSFTPNYSYCGFDTPAVRLGSGSSSSSDIAHGYASVEPETVSSVDASYSRILVTDNASKYSSLDDFTGVITNQSSVSGDFASVKGLDLNVTDGESLIIKNSQVWRSHFRTMMDEQCYVSNANAPGLTERMENDFSQSSKGLTTFLDDASSSGESNEAYIFHDDATTVSPVNISGVTVGDYGNFRPYFMLSDDSGNDNIDEWGLVDLVD